jgi:hypothetical protein
MKLFVKFQWLIKHQITGYSRYIEDILITYDQNKANIEQTLIKFSRLQPIIEFTTEKKSEHLIHFLDVTIRKENNKLHSTPETYTDTS